MYQENTVEIIKTDKKYRNILFAAYLAAIGIAVIFIKFVWPVLLKHFNALDVKTTFVIGETVITIFLLSFIIPAFYLIVTGRKILQHNQIPYPGMKVIRDTKVIYGRNARIRGHVLVWLGYISIVFAVVSTLTTHFLIRRFWFALIHMSSY